MNLPVPRSSPRWRVFAAWIVVALPLGWGVYQSVVKSIPLFRSTSPQR